jgi:hypothetical protein
VPDCCTLEDEYFGVEWVADFSGIRKDEREILNGRQNIRSCGVFEG